MNKLHFKNHYETMEEQKKGITFTEPSRTQQQFAEECDINIILDKFNATGVMSHVSSMQPVYADVTGYGDLAECFRKVENAQAAFDALPSKLRAELDNDPRNLVPYITNPANKERCIEYGIFNKPVEVPVENRIIDNPVKD